jgi:hypothetical protein
MKNLKRKKHEETFTLHYNHLRKAIFRNFRQQILKSPWSYDQTEIIKIYIQNAS